MSSGKWIYWLEELGKEHNELVGKKCANLGELTKAGFRVPPGCALTLEAYGRFLTETGAGEEIKQYLSTFSADPEETEDLPKFDEAAAVIRGIVESKAAPADMEELIASYYDELCQRTGVKDVAVATRSAGPASHPGQYETFLHVKGTSQVIQNIKKVWSSTFNARSLLARARGGFPLDFDPIGVAVLTMVDSKTAGVLFTLNPADGDLSKVVIEGTWGLGEALVSGSVNPDRFVVDKVALEINERVIGTKHTEYVYDTKKKEVIYVDIAPDRQSQCCLEDREIQELVKMGNAIEAHYGCPQDIEWVIGKERPFPENTFVVQARPETVWSKKKKESVLGKRSGYELLMQRAMKRVKVANSD